MVIVSERDNDILAAIQDEGDGVLARRHLKSIFWADKTLRAMQKVMSRLYERGYIQRMTINYQRIAKPKSEPVYWLGWRGILHIAEQMGIEVDQPKNDGENQMRLLERNLRRQRIRWLRRLPSIGKLEHDLYVVDFRLMVQKHAETLPSVMMEWVNESAFRSPKMDKVKFTLRDKDGQRVERERGVCPDGFFLIEDQDRKQKGKPHKLHLLVEVDMATHPVSSRFATNKAAPYAAYIKSPAFQARFVGATAADWLMITTGRQRMHHLIQQTQQTVGKEARWFLFTNWDQLDRGNVLTAPIWYQVGRDEPICLLTQS